MAEVAARSLEDLQVDLRDPVDASVRRIGATVERRGELAMLDRTGIWPVQEQDGKAGERSKWST